MLNALILLTVVVAGAVLLYPPLAKAVLWRATITPLASIIGSGFLVLGPILEASYGGYAPLVMALLCCVAYLFGGAIRFNIAALADPENKRGTLENRLETWASWTLAFAYFVSVAYYLNLFGAFGVSLTTLNDEFHARLLTTMIFGVILLVGWTYGFTALERMEQITVGIKLAIIAGLLFGLVWFFASHAATNTLVFNPAVINGWAAVTLAFGLIVTVQGFETSRYLGDNYDADTRVRSMRLAQIVSAIIYLAYIVLLSYVFERGELKLGETAIIGLMKVVAPILPALLIAAALSAQFSAAVADTGGSGGLVEELTRGRVSSRMTYGVLAGVGLLATWSLNVFEIISYASRAFAAYYALQATIASITASRHPGTRHRALGFAALAALGFLIVAFGAPVE